MSEGGRRANGSHHRRKLSRRFFLLLIGLTVTLGAVKAAGPLAAIRRQGEELSQLRSEKADLRSEHESLLQEQRFLASDAGLEMIARRNGYLRPGERRIVFVPPPGRVSSPRAPSD